MADDAFSAEKGFRWPAVMDCALRWRDVVSCVVALYWSKRAEWRY